MWADSYPRVLPLLSKQQGNPELSKWDLLLCLGEPGSRGFLCICRLPICRALLASILERFHKSLGLSLLVFQPYDNLFFIYKFIGYLHWASLGWFGPCFYFLHSIEEWLLKNASFDSSKHLYKSLQSVIYILLHFLWILPAEWVCGMNDLGFVITEFTLAQLLSA